MLISGDGVIAQIERFATKMVFNRLNPKYFNRALQIMIQKSEKPTGNTLNEKQIGWVTGDSYINKSL